MTPRQAGEEKEGRDATTSRRVERGGSDERSGGNAGKASAAMRAKRARRTRRMMRMCLDDEDVVGLMKVMDGWEEVCRWEERACEREKGERPIDNQQGKTRDKNEKQMRQESHLHHHTYIKT